MEIHHALLFVWSGFFFFFFCVCLSIGIYCQLIHLSILDKTHKKKRRKSSNYYFDQNVLQEREMNIAQV